MGALPGGGVVLPGVNEDGGHLGGDLASIGMDRTGRVDRLREHGEQRPIARRIGDHQPERAADHGLLQIAVTGCIGDPLAEAEVDRGQRRDALRLDAVGLGATMLPSMSDRLARSPCSRLSTSL